MSPEQAEDEQPVRADNYHEEAAQLEDELKAESLYFRIEATDFRFEHESQTLPSRQLFVQKDGTIKHAFTSQNHSISTGLDFTPEQARAWAKALELAADFAEDEETEGFLEVV